MNTTKLNGQVLIEITCYLFFAVLLLYLILSGEYLSYVTPRMKPYLYFTAAVMVLWSVISAARLFRRSYRQRTAHCFVLVIPILLLLLPHGTMNTANLSGSTGLLTGQAAGNASSGTENRAEAVSSSAPAAPAAPLSEDGYLSTNTWGKQVELHGYNEQAKAITVSSDEFYSWLSEISMHPSKFEGFQITMTGAVFKDPSLFAEDEFVPSRLVMSCCVADLAPSGIICRYDQAAELETDAWFTVTGTLFKGEYNGLDMPKIEVSEIVPAEPVEGYLYPY